MTSALHGARARCELRLRLLGESSWRLLPISLLLLVLMTMSPFAARSAEAGNVPECDRARFRIVIDVGHTVQAPGAISARNVPEYEFNLRLAQQIRQQLVTDGFTGAVLLVTEGEARPSLFKRVDTINELQADLVLSIHHDSVPDWLLEDWEYEGKPSHFSDRYSGYSLFVSHDNPDYEQSLLFARLLGEQLTAQGLRYEPQYSDPIMQKYQHELLDADVGVYRYDQLIVLKDTKMPAVLLEAGSIINRDEELVMNSQARRDATTAAVSKAVAAYCEARPG